MLTKEETGLSTQDYETLQVQESFPAFKVIAHKSNLQFDDSGTLPRSPYMAWDGSDYIFTVEPEYEAGSTEFYDTILVYRYSISARTNTLIQTISLGFVVSKILTNPAIGFFNSNVMVYSVRLSSGQQKLTRWRLSSDGSSILATTNSLALSDFAVTLPYFDILLYQLKMHAIDSNVPGYPEFTVSSTVAGGHPIEHAFDGLSTTYFGFNATTGSIQLDVIHGQAGNVAGITKYAITVDASTTNTPRTWTLDRWNGSSWVTLDTQTNLTWTAAQRREFNLSSPAYGRIRINVTAANGANPRFREIEFYAQEALNTNAYSGVLTGIGPVSASEEMVYFSYFHSAANGWRIIGESFDGGVTPRAGEVYGYFPYRPTSLAVVNTNDQYEDYIAITTPWGGVVKTEAEGADVKKSFQANSAVLGFFSSARPFSFDEYGISNGGIFGDTIIDSLPGVQDSSRFSNVSLNYANEFFILTVGIQRASGKGDGIYMYLSKDGMNWSAPQYLALDDSIPFAMIAANDQIISNRGISDSTIILGHSPASAQEDITDYLDSFTSTADPMLQVSLTLDNSDGHFTNHDFINEDNLVVFEISIGYRPTLDGEPVPGGIPILVPLGEVIMESMSRSQDLPEYMIQVTGRDLLSFVTDYVKPLEPRYFDSQYLGFDGFDDVTDTNYGGMSHTSIQGGVGAWSTSGGELIYTPPSTGRANSLVFNTQMQPISQGSVEIVASGANTSAYGIVFLALNKDNYLAVITSQVGDDLSLIEVRNGKQRTIASGTQDDPQIVFLTFDRAAINCRLGTSVVDEFGGLAVTNAGSFGSVPRDTNPFSQFERYIHAIDLTPLVSGYVGIVAS